MDNVHIIQGIFIFLNFFILIFLFIKNVKCKSYALTLKLLNSNVNLLSDICEKILSDNLKKNVELYTESQTILKLANSRFVSLFRYDYCKTYISTKLIFSMNHNGEIIRESYFDNLPTTSNKLNLEILKSNYELCSAKTEDVKGVDAFTYDIAKKNNIEKVYFKNILRNDKPLGYIFISYTDEYVLDEQQKKEILRIVENISKLM